MPDIATNRSVREIVTAVEEGRLLLKPPFQRRLVWNNKDKNSFLETVLLGLPFPEIYVATMNIDLDTGSGQEVLVDGQQRVTTLTQFFSAASDLKLNKIMPYREMAADQKKAFLEYPVAMRLLGNKTDAEIYDIFRRINSTSYSLNEMEVSNAIYHGPFRTFAQEMAELDFFEKRKMFSIRETRRMRDVSFLITVIISMMQAYPNREDEHEKFLESYNEAFDDEADLRKRILATLSFVESCDFPPRGRAWKNADFLVLAVEVDRILSSPSQDTCANRLCEALHKLYATVDLFTKGEPLPSPFPNRIEPLLVAAHEYYATTLQSTGDRSQRLARARALREYVKLFLGVA